MIVSLTTTKLESVRFHFVHKYLSEISRGLLVSDDWKGSPKTQRLKTPPRAKNCKKR